MGNCLVYLVFSCLWLVVAGSDYESDYVSIAHLRRPRSTNGMILTEEGGTASSVVSLRSRVPKGFFGDNHFCTGVLLTELFILTSAQCMTEITKVPRRPRQVLIVAGSINRLNESINTLQVPVTFVAIHVNFTMYNHNDIALMRINEPVPEDHATIDIVPPRLQKPPFGATCKTLGWGQQFKDGPLEAIMHEVDFRLLPQEKCFELVAGFSEEMLCALPIVQDVVPVGPCRGDTGGPLFCDEMLMGIISYTTSCSRVNYPTVFTGVYYHADWIIDIIDIGGQARMQLHRSIQLSMALICLYFVH